MKKNPHAVELSKRRLVTMEPARRSEIAKHAAEARWGKKKPIKPRG